jgi:hypothetical protein
MKFYHVFTLIVGITIISLVGYCWAEKIDIVAVNTADSKDCGMTFTGTIAIKVSI